MKESLLVQTVRHFLEQPELFPISGQFVVACSGGTDSLALLHVLATIAKRPLKLLPLHIYVAHMNHGLRGEESNADAQFVREIAAAWQLPYYKATVSDEARQHWTGSIEAAARTARYRFLRQVVKHLQAVIVTGHTADDQAETVVMHFLRGSGLEGLAGMRPSEDGILRPFLSVGRSATVAYCEQMGLAPRHDSSNDNLYYSRNRIRHEILPMLETYQPQLRAILTRNAEVIARDVAFIEAATDEQWPKAVRQQTADSIILDRAILKQLPIAICFRVLRRAILSVGSTKVDAHLNADSVQRLYTIVADGSGELRQVQCTTGAVAECDWLTVTIHR